MHIVHVITSLSSGGAQSSLFRLCTSDTRNRHTVLTLIGGGDLEAPLRGQGVEVVSVGFSRGRIPVAGMIRLWLAMRRYRPDLVQTWMYHPDLFGGLSARLAGIRLVCWGIRHTALEPGQSSRSSIVAARLCSRLSGLVPRRIVCCAAEAQRLHQALGYREKKMVVIPNGYDLTDFRPFAPSEIEAYRRERLDVDTSCFILGMVGRFNVQKDHQNLFKALADLRERGHDFLCLLVGASLDATNTELIRWIDELDLASHVRLLGYRADIPSIMNSLDLHVLSSSFGEAFPNVIAEAMACGTPCVGTDVGDTAQIIDDTGWVVPPRAPRRLANAIETALIEHSAAPEEWEQRRQDCARRIGEHFTLERMVTSYNAVWSSCLDTGKSWGGDKS